MSRGFTLVELLFTLVVAALLLTLAAPSFQGAVRNSAMSASTNSIIATLQLARSEAIKRRAPVTICPAPDLTDCEGADWHKGWIVFTDDNGDGTVNGTDAILHGEGIMRGSVSVSLPGGQPLQESLTYLPTGFPNLGGLAAAGIMILCDDRQSDRFGRVIVIAQTGRPLSARVADRGDLGVTCENE